MITLYLGRHGETRLNSEERLRSWLDEGLNANGIKEAEAMGFAMSKTPIDRIYCSDLDRADHTAQIVAKHHQLKRIPRQWFRPLNYGDLSGKKLSDIKEDLQGLNDIWKTDPDHEAPNGESFTEFQDRNLGGLHAVLSAAKDGEQIMIVAHLRNALLLYYVAKTGGPLKGDDIQMMDGHAFKQASGSVAKYSYDGDAYGDTLHYEGMFFEPVGSKQKVGIS